MVLPTDGGSSKAPTASHPAVAAPTATPRYSTIPSTAPVAPMPTHSSVGTASTTASAKSMADPAGDPSRITLTKSNGTVLIDSVLVPTRLNSDGELVPPDNQAGWYAEDGWPKPGVLSELRSVIVGHVTCGHNCQEEFFKLPQAEAGDIVRVYYSNPNEVLVFRVLSLPKHEQKDLFTKPDTIPRVRDAWLSPEGNPQRVVTVVTCDTQSGYTNGHSNGNTYIQAVRIV